MIYTHKSGRFWAGYLSVRISGETVIGMRPDGREEVTGWDADDATYFTFRGLWLPVEAK